MLEAADSFGANYWQAAARDYRVSMLDGVGPTGLHDTPTLDEYKSDLFHPRVGARAFVEPKDYEISSEGKDSPKLSHFSLDITTGILYSIDQYLGLWFKGMFSFSLINEKGLKIERTHYDVVDKKEEEYDSVKANIVDITYRPFNGNAAKNVHMSLNVLEGFSLLLGGRYTPVPVCAIDFGAGFKRYVVQCKWLKGEYAYPHPAKILSDAYAKHEQDTKFWVPYDKPVLLEEVFWPFVLQLEMSFVKGMLQMSVGFEYSAFEGALADKNPSDVQSSKSQKEFVGHKRSQSYPLDAPGADALRPAGEQKVWAMSVVDQIDIGHKAHISMSVFSFSCGLSFVL